MVSLPNYEIKRVIGSGAFGYVFEAYDNTNKKKVALKRIEKVGEQLSREFEILFDIKDNENVVKILDFYYSVTNEQKLIQNIVFEFLDDNLENVIQNYHKNKRLLQEHQIKDYIFQTLLGLNFIHKKNIAHRDLKPENILINKEGVVKICDFGSSKILDLVNAKNTPYIVSRYYRAPELILCMTRYTTSIDIWAVGCILAELITLEPIFQGKTEGDQLFAIFKTLGSPSDEEFKEWERIFVNFEKELLLEFKNYIAIDLRKKFFWIKDLDNLIDLIKKMFNFIPHKRITAEEALKHPFFKEEYKKKYGRSE